MPITVLPSRLTPCTKVVTPVTLRFSVTASVISVLVIVVIPATLSPFIFAFASVIIADDRCNSPGV